MVIVNTLFSTFPIYSIFKFAPKTPEKKFLVCENLLGNKSNSDSDSDLGKTYNYI